MSMMGMTLVLISIYFATIFFMLTFLERSNTRIGNAIFIVINIIVFWGLNMCYYKPEQQNFRFLVFDNISPFTFTFMPFLVLFKGKVAEFFKSAIAFLSVGMIVAMMITPQYAYLYNFNNTAGLDYLLDALCHLNCSLFGIYLVLTGQVRLKYKSFVRAVIFMYSAITLVVVMNHLYGTNFFGMCPYGGYSIYMFNLFEDYWATLLAYYVGVLLVLYLGFEFNLGLNKLGGHTLAFVHDENCVSIFDNESGKITWKSFKEAVINVFK